MDTSAYDEQGNKKPTRHVKRIIIPASKRFSMPQSAVRNDTQNLISSAVTSSSTRTAAAAATVTGDHRKTITATDQEPQSQCPSCPRCPIGRHSVLYLHNSWCGCTVKQGIIITGYSQLAFITLLITLTSILFHSQMFKDCFGEEHVAMHEATMNSSTPGMVTFYTLPYGPGTPSLRGIALIIIYHMCESYLVKLTGRYIVHILFAGLFVMLINTSLMLIGVHNHYKGLIAPWLILHIVNIIALLGALVYFIYYFQWGFAVISSLSAMLIALITLVGTSHYNDLADGTQKFNKTERLSDTEFYTSQMRAMTAEMDAYLADSEKARSFQKFLEWEKAHQGKSGRSPGGSYRSLKTTASGSFSEGSRT